MVSEPATSQFSMAETRSQAQLRELMEEVVVAKLTAVFDARFLQIEERLQLADERAASNLAKVFEAIKMISPPEALVQDRNSPITVRSDPQSLRPGDNSRNRLHPPFSGLPRLAKLDFPRFNGDKVKEWLFKCEQFFLLDRTPEESRILLASMHFDDQAAGWHQSIALSGVVSMSNWTAYKELITERFGEVLDDPIAELKNLQETAGIGEYNDKFELIRTRVHLPESDLVRIYLSGLQSDTQMNVRMFRPCSIAQCLIIGQLYETAHPRQPQPTGIAQASVNGELVLKNEMAKAIRGVLDGFDWAAIETGEAEHSNLIEKDAIAVKQFSDFVAHDVLDEMPNTETGIFDESLRDTDQIEEANNHELLCTENLVFDPGWFKTTELELLVALGAHDLFVELPQRDALWSRITDWTFMLDNVLEFTAEHFPFDRGKYELFMSSTDASKGLMIEFLGLGFHLDSLGIMGSLPALSHPRNWCPFEMALFAVFSCFLCCILLRTGVEPTLYCLLIAVYKGPVLVFVFPYCTC